MLEVLPVRHGIRRRDRRSVQLLGFLDLLPLALEPLVHQSQVVDRHLLGLAEQEQLGDRVVRRKVVEVEPAGLEGLAVHEPRAAEEHPAGHAVGREELAAQQDSREAVLEHHQRTRQGGEPIPGQLHRGALEAERVRQSHADAQVRSHAQQRRPGLCDRQAGVAGEIERK